MGLGERIDQILVVFAVAFCVHVLNGLRRRGHLLHSHLSQLGQKTSLPLQQYLQVYELSSACW
jgi:hypothetical protein